MPEYSPTGCQILFWILLSLTPMSGLHSCSWDRKGPHEENLRPLALYNLTILNRCSHPPCFLYSAWHFCLFVFPPCTFWNSVLTIDVIHLSLQVLHKYLCVVHLLWSRCSGGHCGSSGKQSDKLPVLTQLTLNWTKFPKSHFGSRHCVLKSF